MDSVQKKFQEIIDLNKELEASDIHLTDGVAPYMRLRNDLKKVMGEPLSPSTLEELSTSMMIETQRRAFSEQHSIDFAFFTEEWDAISRGYFSPTRNRRDGIATAVE